MSTTIIINGKRFIYEGDFGKYLGIGDIVNTGDVCGYVHAKTFKLCNNEWVLRVERRRVPK